MNFTPKINVRSVISGMLTIAVVGLIGWVSCVASASSPIVAAQDTFAVKASLQASDPVPVVPAVELGAYAVSKRSDLNYYQPVGSWYKSKHWWKGNAPIVGGAAGGALIGGRRRRQRSLYRRRCGRWRRLFVQTLKAPPSPPSLM